MSDIAISHVSVQVICDTEAIAYPIWFKTQSFRYTLSV
jgi:hypothetical protein